MQGKIENVSTSGKLAYLIPQRAKPVNYMHPPPAGAPWQNCEYEWRECVVRDARRVSSGLGLETSGFELLDAPSAVRDFYDERQVTASYYRELEQLAATLTGGSRALVFDHLLRRREEGRPPLSFGRDGDMPSAVGRVHNDYTEDSGRRRLGLLLPDLAREHPFVILNFWRPVLHAALDTPLAVCDARSFPHRDWVAGDILYPERSGEIYLGTYSASHKWYYYPAMAPDELLVFKSYDSRRDSPARMTPHCAFDDPATPADAPPRRSIEARCLVILD